MSRAKMRLTLVAAIALVALLVFQAPVWAQVQKPKPPNRPNDSINIGHMFEIQLPRIPFGQTNELRNGR
jgi:hypothetical protein